MAHSRFSRLPGLASSQINPKLHGIWLSYAAYCRQVGVKPAEYETWKLMSDNSYKMAGV